MGYTTEFRGSFKITPPLSEYDRDRIIKEAETRHGDNFKEDPKYPGFWLHWVPNKEGTALGWDGGEKFYNYIGWLKFLINAYFEPGNYKLDGTVKWIGEDKFEDLGIITVKNNIVTVKGRPRA